MVHKEDEARTVSLLGSPGDSFVDKVYREHGMNEVGRTVDDYAKLQMDIVGPCVGFMTKAILCGKMGWGDYARVGWRLMPFSEHVKKNCAHTIPSKLYREQIAKGLGLAK
eukprot:TRINITY_DN11807_c0_g1_i1.p3 TRINITY_DN11807_c0_g1~~TRINITY_DN11807_c0_g1_i1.p3  ORF type:complete len:110 (-),score=25.94 TRINITY_DN11807_c0_g1_i1:82-411(-)